MCGRISLYSDPDYLARIFDAQLGPDVDPDARPSWNVAPDAHDPGRRRRTRRHPHGRGPPGCPPRARLLPVGAGAVLGEGPLDGQAARSTPGRRPWPPSPRSGRRSPPGASSWWRTASTSGRRVRARPSSRTTSPGPTGDRSPWPVCGSCGGAVPARRRPSGGTTGCRCVPARSSPPRPDPTWRGSTPACRSCSSPRCSTSGSTPGTGTCPDSGRCWPRRRRAPWSVDGWGRRWATSATTGPS